MWSDWIQSANEELRCAARRRIDYFSTDDHSTAYDLIASDVDIAGCQATSTTQGHRATQYRVPDGWDVGSPIKAEFGTMTYGVDYGIKPGSDLSDPYRYVDFDPDDSAEVLGWAIPAPIVYDRMEDYNLGADLWIDNVTDYGVGSIEPLVIGATFDTIPESTLAGTVMAVPPDPGATLSFTVGISPHEPLDDFSVLNAIFTGSLFDEGTVWPMVTVRPQKWRYWIPEVENQPVAGYLLTPAPNLDGAGNNVDVNFG